LDLLAAFLNKPILGSIARRIPKLQASTWSSGWHRRLSLWSRTAEPTSQTHGSPLPVSWHYRIACPLTNDGAGNTTNSVLIERKDGARPRIDEELQHKRKAISMDLPNVDAFRELHLSDARHPESQVPAMTRVFVTGMKFRRFRF
jgi:hypothetical protein